MADARDKVFIVMAGPQGAGKGTVGGKLEKKYGIATLSTGDVFRRNVAEKTELGKLADAYMTGRMGSSTLVPTDVTNRMLLEELRKPEYSNGAIIDGFPREPGQTTALFGLLEEGKLPHINAVVCLDPAIDSDLSGNYSTFPASPGKGEVRLPEEYADVANRIFARRTCSADGAHVYGLANPVPENGKCSIDGAELFVRKDDAPETLARRLNEYAEKTRPAIRALKAKMPEKFVEVNPFQSPDAIYSQVEAGLDRILPGY